MEILATLSDCCVPAADKQAPEPENRTPFAEGAALRIRSQWLTLVIIKPETVIGWQRKGFDGVNAGRAEQEVWSTVVS